MKDEKMTNKLESFITKTDLVMQLVQHLVKAKSTHLRADWDSEVNHFHGVLINKYTNPIWSNIIRTQKGGKYCIVD